MGLIFSSLLLFFCLWVFFIQGFGDLVASFLTPYDMMHVYYTCPFFVSFLFETRFALFLEGWGYYPPFGFDILITMYSAWVGNFPTYFLCPFLFSPSPSPGVWVKWSIAALHYCQPNLLQFTF